MGVGSPNICLVCTLSRWGGPPQHGAHSAPPRPTRFSVSPAYDTGDLTGNSSSGEKVWPLLVSVHCRLPVSSKNIEYRTLTFGILLGTFPCLYATRNFQNLTCVRPSRTPSFGKSIFVDFILLYAATARDCNR